MISFDSAIDALDCREVIGLPTDTVYGIGVDPFDQSAVARLFDVKARPATRPIPILVGSIEDAASLGVLGEPLVCSVERHWPGPLTVVVRRSATAPAWVGDAGRDSVGLRMPDHPTALALLRAYGPLAVTSANRSGSEPTSDAGAARAVFGESVAVYIPGVSSMGEPSTVVDLTTHPPQVVRAGPVGWES